MRIYSFWVYILTNKNHTTLYTGVTNNLVRRCKEHKQKKLKGFTQKYNVDILIYYEYFDFSDPAIAREKQIKSYSRTKKNILIDSFNPLWKELFIDDKVIKP